MDLVDDSFGIVFWEADVDGVDDVDVDGIDDVDVDSLYYYYYNEFNPSPFSLLWRTISPLCICVNVYACDCARMYVCACACVRVCVFVIARARTCMCNVWDGV